MKLRLEISFYDDHRLYKPSHTYTVRRHTHGILSMFKNADSHHLRFLLALTLLVLI